MTEKEEMVEALRQLAEAVGNFMYNQRPETRGYGMWRQHAEEMVDALIHAEEVLDD